MTKRYVIIAAAIVIVFLSACSQSPSNPAANVSAVKASEPASTAPVTAKTAYWQMYTLAYKWAPDQVLLRLQPKDVPGFTGGAGKAEIWEGTFASPAKHEVRLITYAVAAHPPDVYQGVSVGNAIPWGGVTRDVMPVDKALFNVDSDAAYTAASGDADAWLKKNPDKKMSSFQLGNGYNFPAPVWYVVWGDRKSGGYAAYVNATTGKVMKK